MIQLSAQFIPQYFSTRNSQQHFLVTNEIPKFFAWFAVNCPWLSLQQQHYSYFETFYQKSSNLTSKHATIIEQHLYLTINSKIRSIAGLLVQQMDEHNKRRSGLFIVKQTMNFLLFSWSLLKNNGRMKRNVKKLEKMAFGPHIMILDWAIIVLQYCECLCSFTFAK